ncbi:hypothetical protein Vafri_20729 [Volvox africanus]|uniref:Uncharacterized protein n=1 Tax=Volvox africanus TaxID=51714 RepID=A0A8J4BQL7_9CHLO|nr:hypothetical protein Vafri_20729 [Volvox africanus]
MLLFIIRRMYMKRVNGQKPDRANSSASARDRLSALCFLRLCSVLEAVLPVRQQQARWAQSKEAAERAAERAAAPQDPLLVNLLDLAVSGPSSCATSPPRLHGAVAIPAAAGAGIINAAAAAAAAAAGGGSGADCGGEEDDAGRCGHADDGGGGADAVTTTPDGMMGGSPTPAPGPTEPAPCASSSCGTTTTTTTNTDAIPPALRNQHNHHNDLARSCTLNTTPARDCGRNRDKHNNDHNHRGYRNSRVHTPGRSHGPCGGPCGGCSRECGADSHGDSQLRWLDAWRAWVREAALLLQAHDARPNDRYLNRLEDAFMKLKSEVVYLGLRHPELVCNMRCVNLENLETETETEAEFPPDSFWSLVVAGMKLNSQQVTARGSQMRIWRIWGRIVR